MHFYKAEAGDHAEEVAELLNRISLPKLTEADGHILEAEITPEERENGKKMSTGKAPGGDDYRWSFTYILGIFFIPNFLRVFQDSK